jgi:2,3-diketo-5-methylthiopentyl-1-phosphate enolase
MSIEVDYRFPRGVDAAKQAQIIAVGQTAGSWSERWTDAGDRLRSHLAEVVAVREAGDGAHIATVSFPRSNVEGDIASLLTMIFGKYSMAGPAKVVGLRLPDDYGTRPRFGVRGVRAQAGVQGRPLVMGIFKPSLGLSPEEHAAIVAEVAEAGLDVIKDDEIMADLPSAPTLERLARCRKALEEVESRTGRSTLYAVNVTGRANRLLEKARMLVSEGAGALLVNALSYGFPVVEALAADPTINVPIFAHPALSGALCLAPDHGFSYPVVLGTLMAHAGADAVLMPTATGSLPFSPEDESRTRVLLVERGVLPVPSAGVVPGMVPALVDTYGQDVVLNAGTGIMDHPGGPGDGVRAFRDALERHARGESFAPNDVPAGPLRVALERWKAK